MKKLIFVALLCAAAVSLTAQDKLPKAGKLSFGVSFNPAAKSGDVKFQPEAGDFGGEYILGLGDCPKQIYILAKDPLASFNVKYQFADNLAAKASLGFNGSKINYKEYVTDDVALKANASSTDKVVDVVTSNMNMCAFNAGLEYYKGFGSLRLTAGAGLVLAVASGNMKFSYGNEITSENKKPSTMGMTQAKTADTQTLNEGKGVSTIGPKIGWSRPLERKNVGVNTGVGITCDMGLEYFFTENIAVAGALAFTPFMVINQGETYSLYEGWSTTATALVTYEDKVSPGSSATLFGTENFGFRLSINCYF
jgi:hypothetical protein